MHLQYVNLSALIIAAIAVIALEKTKWIQSVAIAELIIALLLGLITADFLRLPISNVDGVLAFLTVGGWAPVLVMGKNKPTLIAASIAIWVAGIQLLIELGWVRIDVIRGLL